MKIFISYLSISLLLLTISTVEGQNTKKADELYNRMGYQLAIDHYGDSEDLTTAQRIRLAESHRLNGHSEEAEMLYRTIIKVDQRPIHYFHLAQALMMNNKVDEAIDNFNKYKSYLSQDDPDQRPDNYLNFIQSKAFDQIKNIEIKNTQSLNTDNYEFSPFIINNGLLFVSSRPYKRPQTLASTNYTDFGVNNRNKDIWTEKDYNKIYKTIKDDEGNFDKPLLFSESLKDLFHQGPLHLNASEDLIYFTSSHTLGGFQNKNEQNVVPLEIYKAILIDETWSKPVPFTKINTAEYNEAHPTLSKDGQTIIFSSDREEGMGGMDLYISHKVDGSWSTPKNMGPSVNTPGNEVFPFLHGSGALYFSSDGLGGYGGLDIFHIEIDQKGKLGNSAINTGFPMNSNKDDFGYNSNDGDQSGYFSSSRSSSIGRDDIFSFKKGTEEEEAKEDEEIVADESINHPALIIDDKKTETVPSAEEVSITNNTIETGDAGNTINEGAIEEGASFTLDKIYYDFDKATLREESFPELNKLTAFLNRFPDVTIELSAHTDSRGPHDYNEMLSQKRADAVVDFLLDQNINSQRIIAKGYGEERLRNTCHDGRNCSEDEHQYNRRTEFKILNLGENTNLVYTNNGPSTFHPVQTQSNRSFSDVVLKQSLREKYGNINTSKINEINSQLDTDGIFRITVGAYAHPNKKIKEMKSLGFDKTQSAPIIGREGISRVLVGSLNDISIANEVSEALYSMGIENDILRFD